MSLLTHLAQVPDFRQPGGNLRHKLLDILVIRVLAVLSGADDFVEMACFAERKLPVLRRYLSLEQGPPSHDTFPRVFQHLDAARCNAAFLGWVRQLLPAAVAEQVCLDGKTLRGNGPHPLHLVSALARAEGLCLAQVARAGKGHELGALSEVLGLLDLSGGALVSLDALGCQPEIAQQITGQGGHYLLALKQNQRSLRAEAERAFSGVAPGHEAWGWAGGGQRTRTLAGERANRPALGGRGRALAAVGRLGAGRHPALPSQRAGPQAARALLSQQSGTTLRGPGAGGRAGALGDRKPVALALRRDAGRG
jgi:hypothetical protein